MKTFTQLIEACIHTPKTNEKINLIADYLASETQKNLPYAFHFLIGKNLGRFCQGKEMRRWCAELAQLPIWLIDETYDIIGDNSETISTILNQSTSSNTMNLSELCTEIKHRKKESLPEKKKWIQETWKTMNTSEIYTFNKLLGGGLRIGATQKNVVKALSKHVNISPEIIEHRLMGDWSPTLENYKALTSTDIHCKKSVQPYPFYLASPIEKNVDALIQNLDDWIIEPKWDGIRAQLVKREQQCTLWSRGNELISESFPDILEQAKHIPNGVYDGELLAWKNNAPLPFNQLQKRLQRKGVSEKIMRTNPCNFIVYDCLEINHQDIRQKPLLERKSKLNLIKKSFPLSPELKLTTKKELFETVNNARENNIEGVMLKQKQSTYKGGRIRGDWWKIKIQPYTIDLVLIYAQKGRGIRAGLYTDYTFAAWHENKLIPVTKAYSGLTNKEITLVNQQLKKTIQNKFGPVRAVEPTIVMEIAFEGIQESSRHKSGIALRFPRIKRLRLDKPIEEANHLDDLKKLL